jgi:hypothetical protein
MDDRSSAHLCKEFVHSPSLVERVLSDLISRVHKNRWYADLKLKHLPQSLQDHLGLIVEYLDFLVEERSLISQQVVRTI